ncbi:hypothetical protein ACIBCO_37420 [Streptomyces violascens]|uniref:hypothetical protein n=1 Tax=Streptomyces violascens TaxID=67381 RepID=UPI0037AC265A
MRKPRKTAVVAVLLSAIGFLGTGTAYGHEHDGRETKTLVINQSNTCITVEDNADAQGQSQNTNVGSSQGCNNTVVLGK